MNAGVTWWAQAWRTLWRDARAGELRLLVVAVALGVAALSSVSFLADRLNGGLQRDARQLLGGDVVVVSDLATPPHIMQRAKAFPPWRVGIRKVALRATVAWWRSKQPKQATLCAVNSK